MSKEWKPGDVAMVTGPARLAHEWRAGSKPCGNVTVMCHRVSDSDDGVDFWRILGQSVYGFLDREVVDARPLVVIDPADREAVERLAKALAATYEDSHADYETEHMQLALREFAALTPAKPEEPQGLGAVVEDDKGRKWVRSDQTDDLPWHEPDSGDNDWRNYSDISAVRILGSGVTP